MTESRPGPRSAPTEISSVERTRRALERRLTPLGRAARRRARRATRRALGRKEPAHMLHPGKTGGTALKAALGPIRAEGRYDIQFHKHDTTIRQLPRGEMVFLMLRDPAERYVSAFNERLRRGLPRYEIPWTPEESIAFEEFGSPDELAVALSCDEPGRRARAIAAMTSIQHVRDGYWKWLGNGAMLQRRTPDLLLVGWMPDLDSVFPRLCERLEMPGSPTLPTDEVTSHRSPSSVSSYMSDQAVENIRAWYTQDYGCVEMCSRLDCFVGPTWTSGWPIVAAPGRPLPEPQPIRT